MYWSYGLLPLGASFFYRNSPFNVKHYMAIDIMKPTVRLLVLRYGLEYDLHIFQLFLYGISLRSNPSLLVHDNCLFGHLWQLEPKFMVSIKV